MAQQNNPFMVTPGIAYAQPGLSAAIDQFGKMRQIQQLQGLSSAAAAGDEQAYGQLLGLSPDVAKQARGLFVQNKAESLMGDTSLNDADRFRQLAALDPTIANAYLKQTQDARKAAEEAQKAALEAKKETIAGGIRQLVPLQNNPELFKAKLTELQASPDFVVNGRPLITAEDVADPTRVIGSLPSLAAWALPKEEFAANFQTEQQKAELAQREEDAKIRRLAEENQRAFQNQQLEIDRANLKLAQERGNREAAEALQKKIDTAIALQSAYIPAEKLPEPVRKRAYQAEEDSQAARDKAVAVSALLSRMDSPEIKGKLGGGGIAKFGEFLKGTIGAEDAVSEVRKSLAQLAIDKTLQNLPQGPATDKDMALAAKGVFDPFASEDAQLSVVRGLLKINQQKAAVKSLEADWPRRNGDIGVPADKNKSGYSFEYAPGQFIEVQPGEPYGRVKQRVLVASIGSPDPYADKPYGAPAKAAAAPANPLALPPPVINGVKPPPRMPTAQSPVTVGAPLPPAQPKPQGLRPQAATAQPTVRATLSTNSQQFLPVKK